MPVRTPPRLAAPNVANLDLASGFVGKWRRVYRSPLYLLSLLLVAACMAVLPMVYLALIAAVGYGVFWHVTHDTGIFKLGHGYHAGKIQVLIFVLPIVIGVGLMLVMLKPLLAPGRRRAQTFSIERHEEPVLYGFVETLCTTIGAPPPKRIDINCEINASASFRRGFWSLFVPGDVVLTIGLPLVAGLRLPHFAGILAHEFGHFSQGVGMRASYVIHTINTWFFRAVYERDRWDEMLHAASSSSDGVYIRIAAGLISVGAWVSRRILWVFLMLARLLSMFMARQMEFDADRHEARFVGATVFASTFPRMAELQAAADRATADVRDYFRKDQLPDDYPALVGAYARHTPADVRARIEHALANQTTSLLSTHPSTPSRIRSAAKEGDEAVFKLDVPSTDLFRHFHEASVKASYAQYKAWLGSAIAGTTFVPVTSLLQQATREARQRTGVEKYLGVEPPRSRPFFLNASKLTPPNSLKEAWSAVAGARARLSSAAPPAAQAALAFTRADEQINRCEIARTILDLGSNAVPKEFGFQSVSRGAVSAQLDRARDEAADSAAKIDIALEEGGTRLSAALRMLHAKDADRFFEHAPSRRARADALVAAMATYRAIHPGVKQLRDNLGQANALLHAAQKESKNAPRRDKAISGLRAISDVVRERIASIRTDAGGTPYPFTHAGSESGQANIGERLVGATPALRDFDHIFTLAGEIIDRFATDQSKVLAELVEIAIKVEAAVEAAVEARAARAKAPSAQQISTHEPTRSADPPTHTTRPPQD